MPRNRCPTTQLARLLVSPPSRKSLPGQTRLRQALRHTGCLVGAGRAHEAPNIADVVEPTAWAIGDELGTGSGNVENTGPLVQVVALAAPVSGTRHRRNSYAER